VFRRVFTVVLALSLLLCAATCVLWVRSYRGYDGLCIASPPLTSSRPPGSIQSWKYVHLWNGQVVIGHATYEVRGTGIAPARPGVHAASALLFLEMYASASEDFAGISGQTFVFCVTRSEQTLPIGVVASLMSILPAAAAIRLIHSRFSRPRPGQCPICGYDLRASKYRCPECGTPITAKSMANPSYGAQDG
jgi:hypothetical protein